MTRGAVAAKGRSHQMVELHPAQSDVFKDMFVTNSCRFQNICASRGWGKSVYAGAAAAKAVEILTKMPPGTPNRNVSLIAPTHSQASDIYYPLLAYQFGLLNYATKSSRRDGTFFFGNEVLLKIWSAEAIERMRGTGQYFVVADEFASWEVPNTTLEDAWESIIWPCIDTRWPGQGKGLIISTPRGMDYFYDLHQKELISEEWKSYHYTYRDSPYLDTKTIEANKALMDPLKFAREYEASFEDSGAQVFYPFDRKIHVDRDLPYFRQGETVNAMIDFNIGVMATCFVATRGNQIHILDESTGKRDTPELAGFIHDKFLADASLEHRVLGFPDPSGRSRKTSAAVGRTDFSILEAHKIHCLARHKAPPIVDSVAAVNRKLLNARGNVELYIHPRCVNTIKSLERTVWLERNPDTAQIDKSGGHEHWSDGLRYGIEYLYPVGATGRRVSYNPKRRLF